MAQEYALFETPYELAQALTVCWKGELPDEIYEVDGKFAVKQDGFAAGSLAGLREQHGWRYSLISLRKKSPVPLRALVSNSWQFRDPLRFHSDGSPRDGGVLFDVSRHNTEYLIGARTHEEAAALLDGLTTHLIEDIAVVPIVVRDAPPFQFFWLVVCDFPLLDVLKRAPGAWWRAASAESGTSIWVQWPYSIGLPPSFLERHPWKAGQGGLVLLNRSANEKAAEVLIAKASFVASRSIEEFADLHVAARVREIQAAKEIAPAKFDIEMRLVTGGIDESLRQRAERLKGEIQVRQRTLDAFLDELNEHDPVTPEPLYLYAADNESTVPDELQRLLVEWTDQSNDLESVMIQRIERASLPVGFDEGDPFVHVVTTAHALAGASDVVSSLGTRLHEYRPQGVRVAFEQLGEWTPFGLRIFAPSDRTLRLYPRLRPSDAAAEQLAAALFGRVVSAEERARWLVLLIDNAHGRISAFRISAESFRPIARAIRWDCAVDVKAAGEATRKIMQGEFEESFVASLEKNLADAAGRVAQERVERKCADLKGQIKTACDRLKNVDETNRKIAASFAAAQKISRDLAPLLNDLRGTLTAIAGELQGASRLSALATSFAELQASTRSYQELETQLAKIRKEIADLQRRGE